MSKLPKINVKITKIDGKNDSKIPKVCVKSEDQTRQASGPVLSLVRVLSLVYGPVSQSIGVRFILGKKGHLGAYLAALAE